MDLTCYERRIVNALLSRPYTSFSLAGLQGIVRLPRCVIGRVLYDLERKGVVERFKVRGETHARLKGRVISELRRLFNIKAPLAYLGLVGFIRSEYPELITLTSLRILNGMGFSVSKVIVASSRECLEANREIINEYSSKTNIPVDFVYLKPDDYDQCIRVLSKAVDSVVRRFSIVCDVTGGTKIMSLALASVARDYNLPMLYIYLETGKPVLLNREAWSHLRQLHSSNLRS